MEGEPIIETVHEPELSAIVRGLVPLIELSCVPHVTRKVKETELDQVSVALRVEGLVRG